jgi:hypothetical protein
MHSPSNFTSKDLVIQTQCTISKCRMGGELERDW